MCVQERVGTVVMLNVPFEERRLTPPVDAPATFETLQYWPWREGEAAAFTPFSITCVRRQLQTAVDVRGECDKWVTRCSQIITCVQLRLRHLRSGRVGDGRAHQRRARAPPPAPRLPPAVAGRTCERDMVVFTPVCSCPRRRPMATTPPPCASSPT